MKLLDRLDRLVRPVAIPNLTQILIAGQVFLFVAFLADNTLIQRAWLQWDQVIQGEVWRLLTFLFVPITTNPIWLFFALYIFYIFGTALEQIWGTLRYNTFLYLGALLTVASAAILPGYPVTGAFLEGTVFLAFATYNPNFELRLFFVLPVKVKWLAWIQAAIYTLSFLSGSWSVRLMVFASVGNYLIFFAPMVVQRGKNMVRRKQWEAKQVRVGDQPRHTCAVCGINSNTHPNEDFRYCSKCDGEKAYCEQHLRNHEHVVG